MLPGTPLPSGLLQLQIGEAEDRQQAHRRHSRRLFSGASSSRFFPSGKHNLQVGPFFLFLHSGLGFPELRGILPSLYLALMVELQEVSVCGVGRWVCEDVLSQGCDALFR